jgi:tetratricopeptide (TPR) repeat protein
MKPLQVYLILASLLLLFLLYLAPVNKKSSENAQVTITGNSSESKHSDINSRINLGISLVESGEDPMKGIMMLREIADAEPGNIRAQFALGVFSMKSGQYEKAIIRFRKVITAEDISLNKDAYYLMGQSYTTLDSIEQAMTSFEKYKNLCMSDDEKKKADQFIQSLKSKNI